MRCLFVLVLFLGITGGLVAGCEPQDKPTLVAKILVWLGLRECGAEQIVRDADGVIEPLTDFTQLRCRHARPGHKACSDCPGTQVW